jgi:Zn-dependent protease with chaperone function
MVDFDFARYVLERRGEVAHRQQTGTAYGFIGERKLRRTFIGARPVAMAIEATTRLWNDSARAELLGNARLASEDQPRVWTAAKRAADNLHTSAPAVYVAPPSFPVKLTALGTDDQPYVVLRKDLADALNEHELMAVVGHELGHIQNGHILYATALHYLTSSAAFFVRWVVQPAIMTLQAWSRRAEVTCDRAALLALRDVDKTLAALVKLELGVDKNSAFNVEEYLKNPPDPKKGLGRFAEVFRSNPYVPKRVHMLRLFAGSALYASVTGQDPAGKPSLSDIDKQVTDLISIF